MQAYEFFTYVTPDGHCEIPQAIVSQLPRQQAIRILILVEDPVEQPSESFQEFYRPSPWKGSKPYDGI